MGTSETEAEVDEFQLFMSIDENIFSLDIAMNNIPAMKILQGLSNNKYKLFSLIFLHTM
jgi:hypothetical protein